VKNLIILATLSCLLLAAFLLIRPRLGEIGRPTSPNTSGRSRRGVPDGAATTTTAPTGTAPTGTSTGAAARTSAPTEEDAARAGVKYLEVTERLILDLVNEQRRKQDGALKDVVWEDVLRNTARRHCDDMLLRNYFDHVNPDRMAPADRIALTHRRLVGLTGENIFKLSGYAGDERKLAAEIMKGWMESPGHRENILRREYTHLGVGVSVKDGEVTATQNFAYVRALLNQPLPQATRDGETLQLATDPAAEKYDYWLSDKGTRDGNALDIGDAIVRVVPGTYKLRFYFREPGKNPTGYTIYTGPQVEVK